MERIILAHGSGGRLHHQLIQEVFLGGLENRTLGELLDAAIIDPPAGQRMAFSTDSFVIDPPFFPGGDIGCLSVYGTTNDLAVSGARPRFLSAGFIIEEGFLIDDLKRVVASMREAAERVGVEVVTGDTKVVGRGQVDKIFINTAGIGFIPSGVELSPLRIKAGDQVIVSGTLGDHGLAILGQREGLSFSTPVVSDCGPVAGLARALLGEDPAQVRCMRDPTRGGLATTLNELAQQGRVAIRVDEERIPVLPAVRGACAMLGLDPMYLANEGKLVAVVAAERAEEMLRRLRSVKGGERAGLIGEVTDGSPGLVLRRTALGVERVMGMLEGEILPRIC
ncbi:MAG: hydrogenase expression/formation protein HypE [Firmicutes bacterium]|nr:hydrogenase expression/formation protein HypE [Bacillota bacterium]